MTCCGHSQLKKRLRNLQSTSHNSNIPKKGYKDTVAHITVSSVECVLSKLLRAKRIVEASEKPTDAVGFKVAIHSCGMWLAATNEPTVLHLRLGQNRIHCYLRNPLIFWFNLRGILNLWGESLRGSHTFSIISPFSIFREWGRGTFSLNCGWPILSSHRCCICTREDVIPVRSNHKPLDLENFRLSSTILKQKSASSHISPFRLSGLIPDTGIEDAQPLKLSKMVRS